MVSGIGVDLCSVSRIKKAMRSGHFRDRIFSPEEISYCEAKGENRYSSYAAGFAAREAFCKASGIPLMNVMFGGNFKLIRDDGKPIVKLSGEIDMPDSEIFISLTHEGDYACAMIVIQKGEHSSNDN